MRGASAHQEQARPAGLAVGRTGACDAVAVRAGLAAPDSAGQAEGVVSNREAARGAGECALVVGALQPVERRQVSA